ncbi:Syntaxin-binding protein 1 [Gaertneriomyces sp. JEL0708]|nr:Syntaxin-binding protein 1 [Gaertneriomyces sp. JEL0708]
MTLKEAIKKKLFDDMVKAVNPPGKWKLMVVDDEALRILNTFCTIADLTEEHVISVEGLFKRRQPQPDREGLFFMSPDAASVQRLIEDFSQPRPPYAAIHVFYSAPLPNSLFDKIKASPCSRYIRQLKELNIEFSPLESHVFTLDLPHSLKATYNPHTPSIQNYELDKISKKLRAVLASLGESPNIRYYDPSGGIKQTPPRILGEMLQAELDSLSRQDPSFPAPSQYQRGTLLIVERAADLLTPLLHHFTYQSMAMDLLQMEDMKYQPPDDEPVSLDSNDMIWDQARHWHIAEVMEYLADAVNKFTTENKAAAFAMNKDGEASSFKQLERLKETMAHLPQYQQMKAKYSIHTTMCQEIMQLYKNRRLERISQVEQDLAVGETSEGRTSRLSTMDIRSILDDPNIDHEDKLRLLMLYIISRNGISDSDRQKLMEQAKLSLEESQAVHNLSMLGVRLSASLMGRKGENRGEYAYGLRDRGKEHKFENSRYTPVLKYILEDNVKNIADAKVFPWVREPSAAESAGRPSTWAASGSVNSPISTRTKGSWATRRAVVSANGGNGVGGMAGMQPRPTADLRANGPRIIVFVLGGITPSEMKVCYDVMKEQQREILVGSTHMIIPARFIDDLKDLHRHGPLRPPRPLAPRARLNSREPEIESIPQRPTRPRAPRMDSAPATVVQRMDRPRPSVPRDGVSAASRGENISSRIAQLNIAAERGSSRIPPRSQSRVSGTENRAVESSRVGEPELDERKRNWFRRNR